VQNDEDGKVQSGRIRFKYNRIGPCEFFVSAPSEAHGAIRAAIEAHAKSGNWDFMSQPKVRFS
jgi:hypothetical protein